MNFTASNNIKQMSKNTKLNFFFNCSSVVCPEPPQGLTQLPWWD